MRTMVACGAAALAIGLGAAPAQAELFRCTGPDGKTIFTDKKDACPGAEPFEPSVPGDHVGRTPKRPLSALDEQLEARAT